MTAVTQGHSRSAKFTTGKRKAHGLFLECLLLSTQSLPATVTPAERVRRRHGHNEQDEPMTTLPLTYAQIAAHPTVLDLYSQRMITRSCTTRDAVDVCRTRLQDHYALGAPPAPSVSCCCVL